MSQGIDGRFPDAFPAGGIGSAEGGDQAGGHGAVFVAVELDVTIEVVAKVGEDPSMIGVEVFHDFAEDVREEILAAERESGGDATDITAVDQAEGESDKGTDSIGERGLSEGLLWGDRSPQAREKIFDPGGVGPTLPHGLEIEIEVAGGFALSIEITFLAENDFVDEAASFSVPGGQPGDRDAGHFALERLEQRHEVPNREDVVLHETAQGIEAHESIVEGMSQEFASEGSQRRFNAGQLTTGFFGKREHDGSVPGLCS